MALDTELFNLKSAGTYRFERDKSTISNETATISNMRLVVGFSKTGPFNTVKLVTSPSQFIKLYGNIDRSLEKRGSYFHRSALVALSAGPILCLNLLNLDPDRDQVVEKSFSTSSNDYNKYSISLPLQSLYNTDKLWYSSDESYLDAIDKILGNAYGAGVDSNDSRVDWKKGILHFSNVGKKPVSILVKAASDYSKKGYEVTLNEWYGEGNVPEYLNGTSFVSDYLVEVYVVGGDFGPSLVESDVYSGFDLDDDQDVDKLTMYSLNDSSDADQPYKRFSGDIVYQSYFDDLGFKRGENDANLNKFLRLPSVDFRAKYVGSLIPNFTDKLGRNIWIQKLINDDTDTIGLICAENVDSIEGVNLDGEFINETIDLIGHNVFARNIGGENPFNDMEFDFLSYGFDYKFESQQVKVDGDLYIYGNSNADDMSAEHPFIWYKDGSDNDVLYADSTYLSVGSKLYSDPNGTENDSSDSDPVVKVVSEIVDDVKPLMVDIVRKSVSDQNPYYTSTGELYVEKDNEAVVDVNMNINVGDYLLSQYDGKNSRLTRVKEVKYLYDNNKEKKAKLVICFDVVSKTARDEDGDNAIVKITPIDKLADRLHWVCLSGFQVDKDAMPNGTNERQNEILDMLRENPRYTSTASNLFKCLIDRDYIQWRYLIDTFGLGIEEECKNVYTQLCLGRKAGFAIVNCPSQADFKKSVSPSFTNKLGGVEAEFIAKGGDLSKNPDFLFSLPSIENGASWGAYYYPYLRITDLGASKSVPPAAYVSNLYIQKYNRGFAWSIVAGQKRGVISGNQVVGVEATLISDNRDWLEPVGINPIIWENGVGVEIYANKTAKQKPVSALSSAHVREAAIYIQDGVESILRRYVFEFNTAQTRLEIKTLVDDFLNTMKSNGGIYDFRTVMDTTNNTPEVIDSNKGIIDIYVEIVRGLEIIAQRLTILRNGAIAAGGFDE